MHFPIGLCIVSTYSTFAMQTLRLRGGFLHGVDNGIRRGRPHRRRGKKHAGGMFFRPGENPWAGDGIPEGCWLLPIILFSVRFTKAGIPTGLQWRKMFGRLPRRFAPRNDDQNKKGLLQNLNIFR